MDHKARDTATINAESAFTNELNMYYARFKISQAVNANNRLATEDGDIIREVLVNSIAEHDVQAALRRLSTRKAAGPGGTASHLLRCCANQLAGVLTHFHFQRVPC